MSHSPVQAVKSWTIKGIGGGLDVAKTLTLGLALVVLVLVDPAGHRRLSRRIDQIYLEYQDRSESPGGR